MDFRLGHLRIIHQGMRHRILYEAPEDSDEDLGPGFMKQKCVQVDNWRTEVITKAMSSPEVSTTALHLAYLAKSKLIDLTETPTVSVLQAITICDRDVAMKISEDDNPCPFKSLVNYSPFEQRDFDMSERDTPSRDLLKQTDHSGRSFIVDDHLKKPIPRMVRELATSLKSADDLPKRRVKFHIHNDSNASTFMKIA